MQSIACRIGKHNRIVVAVSEEIIPLQAAVGTEDGIGRQEPADIGVVVSGVEIVPAGFRIVVVPTIAERVHGYDAWGKVLSVSGSLSSTVGAVNPFRYRGYYYDVETGWYYLNARYYDPKVGRFLSPDTILGANGGLQGYNLFAYCNNNPVMFADPSGNIPRWLYDVGGWIGNSLSWIYRNIYKPVYTVRDNIEEDIYMYDKNNTSEEKVLEAHYFSSYKGSFVVKLPIGKNAASYGVMFIGDEVTSTDTVKHEYGHIVQFQNMGFWDYTLEVAIPSVTANILDRQGKLPYDYYGSKWEAEADRLGGVQRSTNNIPWPDGAYNSYNDLIEMFFN